MLATPKAPWRTTVTLDHGKKRTILQKPNLSHRILWSNRESKIVVMKKLNDSFFLLSSFFASMFYSLRNSLILMFQIFSRKSYFWYILEFQGTFFFLNMYHTVIVAIYSFSLVILMLKFFSSFLNLCLLHTYWVFFPYFSLVHVKAFSPPPRHPVLPVYLFIFTSG